MAQTMQINKNRSSYYWCGDPYNNMVFGNTGIVIKEGLGRNTAGNAETTSAGIVEFDLSVIPENRVVTKITLNVPVVSITAAGEAFSKEELQGYPIIMKAWRCTKYDLSNFTALSHGNLVNMMTPYNGYSILMDEESANTFSAASAYGGVASITMSDIQMPKDKKIYYVINRENRAQQAFTVVLGNPYLTVEYDTIIPNPPTDLNPNNTLRNKNGVIRLSWAYLDEQLGTAQSKFDVIYSTDNFATQRTITQVTSNNFCDIPANTFQNGQQVKWRVRTYNSFGDPSEYSTIALFSVGATPPDKPEPLKPVNVVNSTDVVMFGWKYVDQYQGKQGAYNLQYKKGNVVKEVTGGAANFYALSAGTLEGGDYLWRVRTANQYGEYGDWCDWTAFYSIGQPDKPVITEISNDCRPEVAWNVTEQDAWEIQIMQGSKVRYSSGIMPDGKENRYKIPEYLPNGNYVAVLKVRNVYGLWSEETKQTFVINANIPEKPSISLAQHKESVTITVVSKGERNLLYREIDGETVVVELTETEYTDFTVSGAYKYYVRALSANGYADSDPVTGSLLFNGITLAGKDSPDNYVRLGTTFAEYKKKTVTPVRDITLFNCNGRIYPVAQTSNFKSYAETHEYFLSRDEYRHFAKIQDENSLYFVRDGGGTRFYAVMTNYSSSENEFGYVVGFTLEKVEV